MGRVNLDRLTDLTAPAQLGDLVCAFSIDTRPIPKGRPRFGRGRTYTDERTAAFEAHVALVARQAMKGRPPVDCDVRLIALFEQVDGRRADIDNCVKSLADGIAVKGGGPVLVNDSQIVELRARLVRGAHLNRITVLIEEMP